ncbi:McrC family protein [Euryarchaeota archaeon]|nr:McrC family protein [Euryarchaeota archaeon]
MEYKEGIGAEQVKLRTVQVIKEHHWTKIDSPSGLDQDELYRSLMDYKKLVYGETSGKRSPCFFNVKQNESHLEVEQKGLFGWLNFGTKEHPFTLVFQPKMMYVLDLDNDGDLDNFSRCLFQMKMITESRKNPKDKRKSGKDKSRMFLEKALSKGLKESEFKLELLEEIFTTRLESALSEGVARQYTRKNISHPYLKGKILPSRLIPDLWTNSGYLSQQVQELSANIPLNQLFAWCCNHLLGGNLSDPELVQRLTVLTQRLKSVEIWGRPNDSTLDRLENLPPMQSYMQDAVDIALMIARDEMTLLNDDGSRKASGVVIDANYAFEDFVGYLFETISPHAKTTDKLTKQSYGFSAARKRDLYDMPDIFFQTFGNNGKTVSMTFDAKHTLKRKVSELHNYRNQTITAAWSRNCEVCGLIFPRSGKSNKPPHFELWKLKNNLSSPNCYSEITLDASTLWMPDSISLQSKDLENKLWVLYYYVQVETALRNPFEISNNWIGHINENEFDERFESIKTRFASSGDIKQIGEELFLELQQLVVDCSS